MAKLSVAGWAFRIATCLAGLAMSVAQAAADLESVWKTIDAWQGAAQATISTNLETPYSSEVYVSLVEGLLSRGFKVRPETSAEPAAGGLLIELQSGGGESLLVVRRASDGSYLAMERLDGRSKESASPGTPPAPAASGAEPRANQRWSLDGYPVRLASLPSSNGRLTVALLEDDALRLVRLDGGAITELDRMESGISNSRALYLGTARLAQNGPPELLALWGQDHTATGRGTETRPVGRILAWRGDQLRPLGDALRGHLRVVSGTAYFQPAQREYRLYSGQVRRLEVSKGEPQVGTDANAWADQWLFETTPLGNGTEIRWDGEGSLSVFGTATEEGRAITRTVEIGRREYPRIYVRRRHPEIPLGPQEAVLERTVAVPPRLIVRPGGEVLTIERGRIPYVSDLEALGGRGADRILAWGADGSRRPLTSGLSAYILDFARTRHGGEDYLLLLLNDQSDGSGRAGLMLTPASR